MKRVLIFSDHEDNHCKKIASILKDMNIGVDIIDPILLYSPNSGKKLLGDSINIQEDLVSCLGISDGFDEYSGVWMRRLGAPYVARCQYQADDEYFKEVFSTHHHWLCGTLDQIARNGYGNLFVNTPDAMSAGENKLLQGSIAMQNGLTVPATLISRNFDAISSFTSQYDKFVCKSLA